MENCFYENAQPAKAEPVNAQQDESQSKDEIPVVLKSEFVFNEEKFTAYSGEYEKTAKALLGVSITALLVYVYPFISTLVSLIYNPRPSAILSFLCFACSITLVVFSSLIYKKRKTFEKSDIKKTAKRYIVGIVFSAISVTIARSSPTLKTNSFKCRLRVRPLVFTSDLLARLHTLYTQ